MKFNTEKKVVGNVRIAILGKSVDTIGTLTTKLPGQRQSANTKMSIPPMPTPYGVSRQTIFLGVNIETNFWRRSEVYKKAVTP